MYEVGGQSTSACGTANKTGGGKAAEITHILHKMTRQVPRDCKILTFSPSPFLPVCLLQTSSIFRLPLLYLWLLQ